MFVWTIRDLVAVFAVLVAVAAIMGLQLLNWWRQRRCLHVRVFESGACDAICVHCRKNLGFMGTYRENQRKRTK